MMIGSEESEILAEIMKYLPLILPLLIVQLALAVFALVHALKHPNYKTGNKTLWILVILFVNLIGPVLYFVIGRGEETEEEE